MLIKELKEQLKYLRNIELMNENEQAIVVLRYLMDYSLFEKKIKEIFYSRIEDNKSIKNDINFNILYRISEIKNDMGVSYKENKVTFGKIKLSKEQNFQKLSFSNIVYLSFKFNIIDELPKNIDSLSKNTLQFETVNVIKKLSLVRNIIAHETGYLSVNEKNAIDSLSNEMIKKNLPKKLKDIEGSIDGNLQEEFKNILINQVYLSKLMNLLNS